MTFNLINNKVWVSFDKGIAKIDADPLKTVQGLYDIGNFGNVLSPDVTPEKTIISKLKTKRYLANRTNVVKTIAINKQSASQKAFDGELVVSGSVRMSTQMGENVKKHRFNNRTEYIELELTTKENTSCDVQNMRVEVAQIGF